MHAAAQTAPISPARLWTARAISGLTIAFMIFDGVIHVMKPAAVVDAFGRLGYPINASVGIGVTELICTAFYALPRTAVLGAILLTAVFGGAIATHVRVGDPLFDTYIFPALMAALLWGGLLLRDERLRALLLRRT